MQELESKYAELDHTLQNNYSDTIAIQRETVKKEINSIKRAQSEFHIHRVRQKYYFHGSKPSHLLAMKIRSSDQFSDIPSIKSKDGMLVTEPRQINVIFQ